MFEAETPERPTTELTRRTISGLQWTYLGAAAGAVLQFGMTAVMARLLTPAAFGLVALAGLFLRFVNYFAKAGISQALIQKATLSAADVRAGFALSAGLAGAFSAVVFLFAPLAGTVAQDPDVVPVLRWLALGLVLQGLGAPAVALLRRQLRFKALAFIDLGSYFGGYLVVGLAMALTGAGVYALVAAMLTQMLLSTVAAYTLVRHPLLPTRARDSYRAIVSFGARVSVVGFLEFLQANLDTLAVGRWAGSTQLGLYNRAHMISALPAYQLSAGLSQVLFPSFSSIQRDRQRLLSSYLSAVGMTAAIILPLNAGMAVAAREIVLVVLGPQWVGSIDVMPWLLLSSSVALIGHFAGLVAEAQAALNAKMLIAGLSAGVLVLLLSLAQGRSLAAYGAALAATAFVSHLGYLWLLTRTLETSLLTLVRPYGPALLGAVSVAASISGCRFLLLELAAPPISLLLTAEVLTGAVTLAMLFRYGPLRVFRADLATRIARAGLLDTAHGFPGRAVQWLVGPAKR
jgi:lipopolysaccharide exporter